MNLPDTVTVLKKNGRTFYIVGTAHVSEESVREVTEVIEQVRPDTVCVELCEARYKAITDESRWKNLDIFKVIKEGKTLFLMANLALGAYQRRIGQKLGVKPGAEMVAAAKKAEEVGAKLELVDRDIHITLKRTWANVGFWRKMTLLGGILEGLLGGQEIAAEDIEKLKEKSHLSEVMAEFARVLPEVKVPLIDERDLYMMSSIEEVPGDTVVAIVGAGHVEGMVKHFQKPVDREALEVIPPTSGWVKALKWAIPVLIMAAFSWGYHQHGHRGLEEMLTAWILPNSIMAALFTLAAGAKLGSIVAAFIASPITSLNPLLPAGVVVGLVEAWLRRPTVADAERINEDVHSIRGVYRNAFTRVLLVAAMATFGSAAGAWIGISWVFSLLSG
jgi:pheromone shutdown-related protein TraB